MLCCQQPLSTDCSQTDGLNLHLYFFFLNNGTFLVSYITVDWNTPDFWDSRVSCSATSSTSHRAAAHTVIVKTVHYTDFTHLLTAVTPFSGLWQSNLWSCHHNFELHLIFLSGILLWHCNGWKSFIRKLDLHGQPMLWSAPSSGWCLQFWFVLFRYFCRWLITTRLSKY